MLSSDFEIYRSLSEYVSKDNFGAWENISDTYRSVLLHYMQSSDECEISEYEFNKVRKELRDLGFKIRINRCSNIIELIDKLTNSSYLITSAGLPTKCKYTKSMYRAWKYMAMSMKDSNVGVNAIIDDISRVEKAFTKFIKSIDDGWTLISHKYGSDCICSRVQIESIPKITDLYDKLKDFGLNIDPFKVTILSLLSNSIYCELSYNLLQALNSGK